MASTAQNIRPDLPEISRILRERSDILQEWLEETDGETWDKLVKKIHNRTTKTTKKQESCQADVDRPRLLLELILDISNDLDMSSLSHKILVNVGRLTSSDRCSLYLVKGGKDSRYLLPQMVDVTVTTSLDEAVERAQECAIIELTGDRLVTRVTLTGEQYTNRDALPKEKREEGEVVKNIDAGERGDETESDAPQSIACLPVKNHQGGVIGVVEMVKKQSSSGFTDEELQILEKYLTFCGVRVENAQMFEVSLVEYKKNQMLLGLARSLFQEQMSLDRLINMIITEAKELLKCERCTVFLLDLKLYDQEEIEEWLPKENSLPQVPSSPTLKIVSDNEENQSQGSVLREEDLVFNTAYEMTDMDSMVRVFNRLEDTKRLEVAKYVAANSEVLNVESVEEWCGEELIEADGFQPRTMLSLPIYNGQRTVIGVAQLINKVNGLKFDETDISLFEAFAIFCGIGIHNTKMYESAYRLMAKQKVALDCLSYHATANDNDTVWLTRESIPQAEEIGLYSYKFIDGDFNDSTTVKIVIRMFLDFDLVSKFNIPYKVLCRWALSVKKNYRPVKYHNWRHGLNVCQTMFTMLKTGKMERFMVDLEILGLLVACLCHDLDHRGTNNAYQTKVTSPLAVLYSTSTMEHHHFDQCVMILSSDGNNIFQGLSTEEYRQVMQVVEMAILSTDLASYFDKRQRFLTTADAGEIDWQEDDKKRLLCGMLMTASDVSAIAKPWEVQHKLAKLVADEFFDQGDMEKLQLNITPIAMMDREKKDELPQMQVDFIDGICIPLYTTLSESFPWIRPLLEGAMSNREKWADLAEKVDMGLTWIDHDTIEQPVEEVEVGTLEAQGLELTVETLRCRQDADKSALVKKRSFRSLKSPVRPPVGFFNRKLSTRQGRGIQSTGSESDVSSSYESTRGDAIKLGGQSPDREESPPIIVLSKVEQV